MKKMAIVVALAATVFTASCQTTGHYEPPGCGPVVHSEEIEGSEAEDEFDPLEGFPTLDDFPKFEDA